MSTANRPYTPENEKHFPATHRSQCSWRGLRLPTQGLGGLVLLAFGLALSVAAAAQDKRIFINDRWPIQGPKGPNLSPPHVEPTNECSQSVYVDSFIPHATIRVFLGGV